MPEEQNNGQSTTSNQQTTGNSPDARTTDGTLKDQKPTLSSTTDQNQDTSTKSSTETDQDNKSLLNRDGKTEAKGEAKDGDKKEGEKKPDAKAGAPEKYEKFKVPEGYELDEKKFEEVSAVFKKQGLSQDQAQELVDYYNKVAIDQAKAPLEAYQSLRNEWREKISNDAAFGDGKGDLKPEVKQNISALFETVGDAKAVSDFKEAMDFTGAGDHPAFVALMSKLGSKFREGASVNAGGPSKLGQTAPGAAPKSAASAMWPNLKSSTSG